MLDRKEIISEFARLARLNGRRQREAKRRNDLLDAQWYFGRAGAYLTAARILKAQASTAHLRRLAALAGRA